MANLLCCGSPCRETTDEQTESESRFDPRQSRIRSNRTGGEQGARSRSSKFGHRTKLQGYRRRSQSSGQEPRCVLERRWFPSGISIDFPSNKIRMNIVNCDLWLFLWSRPDIKVYNTATGQHICEIKEVISSMQPRFAVWVEEKNAAVLACTGSHPGLFTVKDFRVDHSNKVDHGEFSDVTVNYSHIFAAHDKTGMIFVYAISNLRKVGMICPPKVYDPYSRSIVAKNQQLYVCSSKFNFIYKCWQSGSESLESETTFVTLNNLVLCGTVKRSGHILAVCKSNKVYCLKKCDNFCAIPISLNAVVIDAAVDGCDRLWVALEDGRILRLKRSNLGLQHELRDYDSS